MSENYQILGVSETATEEEIKEAYRALKKRYNEERWLDGEAGTNAARMIEKVDNAYEEILRERREKRRSSEGKSVFDEVAELIKKGHIDCAQEKLDSFNERNAEWHYLQSVIYYKKNWTNESKKQLEIAIQMDPSNVKYRAEYDKLKARADYRSETGGAQNVGPDPVAGDEQMGGDTCSTCANFCSTFLCVNCLFNLCCGCR